MPMRSTTDTAALIKGARVEIIAEAGHFPWLEQAGRSAGRRGLPRGIRASAIPAAARCD